MKLRAKRIYINKQGYDGHSYYWGVGNHLYWVYLDDGSKDWYVRAYNANEAKRKVLGELS